MYKVGDRVRVKTLDEIDKDKGIEIGDIYSIEWIDDEDDDEVGINLESEKKHYLFKTQIVKVEEEVKVKEFKVGDRVRLIDLMCDDEKNGLYKGSVHTITIIRSKNSVGIRIGSNNEYPLINDQIVKVEEEVKVKEFKVGDKVKVLAENPCSSGAEKGKVYTVKEVDGSGVRLKEVAHFGGWVTLHYVELANKISFTFPEMVQKLIDCDFEVGTELVADGDSYFVDKLFDGRYGLSPSKSSYEVSVKLGATSMNSTWTVKEEPIKEMSIEELQKELGYKIKITQ